MKRPDFQKQARPTLGSGVFTLAEVARYTNVHPSTVRSWFKGRGGAKGQRPVFQSDYLRIGDTYSVSFLDLVDVLVVSQFRAFGVSMPVVRRAHTCLQTTYGQHHPFCRKDLCTDGKQIIERAVDEIGDRTLREVVSGQKLFPEIEKLLDHIDYSEADRLAKRWRVAEGVVIDPAVNRGKPCIAGTGITTFVIHNTYVANGRDAEFVAGMYDLDEVRVHHAVNFEQSAGQAA